MHCITMDYKDLFDFDPKHISLVDVFTGVSIFQNMLERIFVGETAYFTVVKTYFYRFQLFHYDINFIKR